MLCHTVAKLPIVARLLTVFFLQALQYLRKVCNHPALVMGEHHPLYHAVMEQLKADRTSLHDIRHSAKLVALK